MPKTLGESFTDIILVLDCVTILTTYRAAYTEDVAVVFVALHVACDVRKVVEVLSILTGAEYVTDLMLANDIL